VLRLALGDAPRAPEREQREPAGEDRDPRDRQPPLDTLDVGRSRSSFDERFDQELSSR
jgi:hypothetical protein